MAEDESGNGVFVVQRDSGVFAHVVNYLHDHAGTLEIQPSEVAPLYQDAVFYGLAPLAQALSQIDPTVVQAAGPAPAVGTLLLLDHDVDSASASVRVRLQEDGGDGSNADVMDVADDGDDYVHNDKGQSLGNHSSAAMAFDVDADDDDEKEREARGEPVHKKVGSNASFLKIAA